jgi:hypothetical protein
VVDDQALAARGEAELFFSDVQHSPIPPISRTNLLRVSSAHGHQTRRYDKKR